MLSDFISLTLLEYSTCVSCDLNASISEPLKLPLEQKPPASESIPFQPTLEYSYMSLPVIITDYPFLTAMSLSTIFPLQ